MIRERFPIAPKPGAGSQITNVRLAKGVSDRIDEVLYPGELRSDFMRAAVEAELKRREAQTEQS